MADETKALDVQKQEITLARTAKGHAKCMCFIPRADIFETDENIYVVVDVPGANESSIDITIEKNVLTMNAFIEAEDLDGYGLNLNEYAIGDYQRSFRLSNTIDRDKIQATVKDGVLRLQLPKAGEAKIARLK